MVYRIVNDLVAIPPLERNTTSYYIINSYMSYSTIPCPIYQNIKLHAFLLPRQYNDTEQSSTTIGGQYLSGSLQACWYLEYKKILFEDYEVNTLPMVIVIETYAPKTPDMCTCLVSYNSFGGFRPPDSYYCNYFALVINVIIFQILFHLFLHI